MKSFLSSSLICAASLLVAFWLGEAAITLLGPKLLLPSIPNHRLLTKQAAAARGDSFDERTIYDVVSALRTKQHTPVFPASCPNHFVKTELTGSKTSHIQFNSKPVLPLSLVSDATYVYCNESGHYLVYQTDEKGFVNPPGTWNHPISIATVGDSFTQGACVPPGKSFVELLRKQHPVILNLGFSANGSLQHLAVIKEYLTQIKPKTVVWFHFENDLEDLQRDLDFPLLTAYLDPNFKQGLFAKTPALDTAIGSYLESYYQALGAANPSVHAQFAADNNFKQQLIHFLTLKSTRTLIRAFTNSQSTQPIVSKKTVATFATIITQAQETVSGWGGELLFVYLPQVERYSGLVADGQKLSLRNTHRDAVLQIVRDHHLKVIDLHGPFLQQKDPLSLFYYVGSHYNEAGHKLVADTVNTHLNNGSLLTQHQSSPKI